MESAESNRALTELPGVYGLIASRLTDVLRVVVRDGVQTVLGRCPQCGDWCELDDDQLHGRVSTFHDADHCGYHETKDWWHDHVS